MCVSSGIYSKVTDFKIMTRTESDHLPLLLTIPLFDELSFNTYSTFSNCADRVQYKWSEEHKEEYTQEIMSDQVTCYFDEFMEYVFVNIDMAVDILLKILQFSGRSMLKKDRKGRSTQPVWFDMECVYAQILNRRI